MAIFETRRWIDTAVAEARADPIVSRPGEWDFDPGFDREAIVRRAEQTIAALAAERATVVLLNTRRGKRIRRCIDCFRV